MYFSNWGRASFGAVRRLRLLAVATVAALILMLSITTVPALADDEGDPGEATASSNEASLFMEGAALEITDEESADSASDPDAEEGTDADSEAQDPSEAPDSSSGSEGTAGVPGVSQDQDEVAVEQSSDDDVVLDEDDTDQSVDRDDADQSDDTEESQDLEPGDDEDSGPGMSLLADRPLGAVQDLAYCKSNSLPRNDDGSSPAVTLPFSLNFFGEEHDTLYVNNNGNVTFDSPLSIYTPFNLTGNTDIPMIAPYFADIDTRNEDSLQTTYGSQGNSFCVNWVDVGYFGNRADKLISAQLIIEDRSDVVPGAFRMTFNYGPMEWETGEASDGVNGLGGDSVAVGYTSGTGNAGEFIQLPGSLVNGAMIDGGPNALSAGSRNSNVRGRYIFDVGLSDVIQQGSVDGTVTDSDGAPVADVEISVCDSADACVTATTSATGTYSVAGLTVGDYTVKAAAPADSGMLSASAPATVNAGETTTVNLVLNKVPDNDLIGIVFDEDGDAFPDVTVTLEQLQDGSYVAVPSGSVDLLASTSQNPVQSDAEGTYHWIAVDGTYRVVAEAENCAAVTSEPVTRPIEGAEDNDEVADVAYDFVVTLVCVDPPVVVPPVVTPPVVTPPVVTPPVVTPPVTTPVVPPVTVPPATELPKTGADVTAPVAFALLFMGLGAAGIMTRRRMRA